MPQPDNLLISWTDVALVALSEPDLIRIEKFSHDLAAVLTVAAGAENDIYSFTINGESISYTRQANETETDVVTAIVNVINTNRVLFRLLYSQTKPANPVDRAGANFDDELEVLSLVPWGTLVIDNLVKVTLTEGVDGEPIRLGGRSRVLELAARRCSERYYQGDIKRAQSLYAAHRAVMAISPAAGQGTKASENIDGESQAWTMPTNNPRPDQELLMTVYGKELWSMRRRKRPLMIVC